MNIIFNDRICSQKEPGPVDPVAVWKGAAAGVMGGGFAAFFPVVTGGVGGFLAGHAASIRDERAFMVSQGASRLVYYVGGILLFFVPGLHLLRGGGAWLLGSVFEAWSFQHYLNAISAIAISGSVSLCLLFPLARIVIYLLERNGVRRLSLVALAGITLLVWFTTGLAGILVMIVSAGTGMIPVAFGARRMNGLGVIMLPLACGMSGFGGKVAAWLGL